MGCTLRSEPVGTRGVQLEFGADAHWMSFTSDMKSSRTNCDNTSGTVIIWDENHADSGNRYNGHGNHNDSAH